MSRLKLPRIKLGDPQPIDCPECKDSLGYQVTDNVRGTYTIVYNSDGSEDMGAYGDSMITGFKSKNASCSNCGHSLNFKIERN